MVRLPERIKERRKALGMTLLQLADRAGVKEATAQRWESGNIKTIKYETIELLADILHCSPSYLMGWDDKIDPAIMSDDEVLNEVTQRLAALPAEKLQAATEYIRFLSKTEGN